MWHRRDCQGTFFSPYSLQRSVYEFLYLQIIQLSPSRRPTALLILDPSPTPYAEEGTPPLAPAPLATVAIPPVTTDSDSTPAPYAITSVAWAPSCGRSYHLIATGSRDGHVRIWRVKPGNEGGEPEEGESEGKWTASVVADFDHHKWVTFLFIYRGERVIYVLCFQVCSWKC